MGTQSHRSKAGILLRWLDCLKYKRILGGDFEVVEKELDLEWITLIKEAMAVGVTKDEILEYLHTNREERKVLVK
jgi:hypothetical protein